MKAPKALPIRSVGEWEFKSTASYVSPFADVAVDGVFTSPTGKTLIMPAFYDGNDSWKLRFNPHEIGEWKLTLRSVPANPDFHASSVARLRSEGLGTICCGRPRARRGATHAKNEAASRLRAGPQGMNQGKTK